MAIKCIFFESGNNDEENYSDGVLLENEDGKLLITKDTLTSMVNAVVSGFEGVRNSQTKIRLDDDNNLSIILMIDTGVSRNFRSGQQNQFVSGKFRI